ncbi:hypothetical protein PR048_031413 [Dryococelus australis]|uniref:Protein Wnt n=1 Tax=Dryococelus australis TaxID=614101 RepID=A0ABQ9G569_9NEOP|nr:hypothetical protein PR048_031413 [Dryococelus australis]
MLLLFPEAGASAILDSTSPSLHLLHPPISPFVFDTSPRLAANSIKRLVTSSQPVASSQQGNCHSTQWPNQNSKPTSRDSCTQPETRQAHINGALPNITIGLPWFSSSQHTYHVSSAVCKTLPGLSRQQLDMCRRHPDVALAAVEGLQLAVDECQHQFQRHRWNCSALRRRSRNPHSSAFLHTGASTMVPRHPSRPPRGRGPWITFPGACPIANAPGHRKCR